MKRQVKRQVRKQKNNRFNQFANTLGLLTSNIGTLVILLVLGHFLLGGFSGLKQWIAGDTQYDPRVELPVYETFKDEGKDKYQYGREFSKAQSLREFKPHYLWRSLPMKGTYVNVGENGLRRTVKADLISQNHPEQPPKKVYMLGGSTMWGEGSPDSDTIPSRLQAILGEGYDVYNLGEIGYMSVQEYNYLLERLTEGERPDVVVFYDGANDGYTSVYSPGEPRGIHSIEQLLDIRVKSSSLTETIMDVFRKSHYQKLGKLWAAKSKKLEAWDQAIEPKIEANITKTLDSYDELIRQVQAISGVYGFEPYFFWQPVLFSGTRHMKGQDYEQAIIDEASPVWVQSQQRLFQSAKEQFTGREAEHVYFLGHVLDEVEGPVYIDWCHMGPRGNQVVAEAMARRILKNGLKNESP